jgi:hypothetical protein
MGGGGGAVPTSKHISLIPNLSLFYVISFFIFLSKNAARILSCGLLRILWKCYGLIAKIFYAVKILVFYTISRAAARCVSSRLEIFSCFLTFTFLTKEQL